MNARRLPGGWNAEFSFQERAARAVKLIGTRVCIFGIFITKDSVDKWKPGYTRKGWKRMNLHANQYL